MALIQPFPFEPGFRLIDGDQLNKQIAAPMYSGETGIAASGSSISDAYVLNSTVNILTTVAAGSGVQLPPLRPGRSLQAVNRGANPLLVYPFPGDQIETLGASNPTTLGSGSSATYFASDTVWYVV